MKKEEEGGRRNSDRMIKRYWILRALYYQRTESSSTLHAIAREIEEKMRLTVRDQDIKSLIDELISRGVIVRTELEGSNYHYQISEFGINWWERHGESLMQLL